MMPGTCRKSCHVQSAEAAKLDAAIAKNVEELGYA